MQTASEIIRSGLRCVGVATADQCGEFLRAAYLYGGAHELFPRKVFDETDPGAVTRACHSLARTSLKDCAQRRSVAVIDSKFVDCGRVTARYTGGVYFGNFNDRLFPIVELAEAITIDLPRARPLRCNRWPLYCSTEDDSVHLQRLHGEHDENNRGSFNSGRSEILTNTTAETSFYCALQNSQHEEVRRIALSWCKLPWAATVRERCASYVGAASVTIDGNEFRVCTCFDGDCHLGEQTCQPALEALHRRMNGTPFILLSVQGFSAFRRERGRWPEGVQELFPGPTPESGKA